jgi:L-cystine uptake protein TcyP (sodium:dicarboxylate symporter family)
MLAHFVRSYSLVSTAQLTIVLIITAVIFAFFIGIAVLKMYKLKAENKRLMDKSKYKSKVEEYTDFTDGHLYDTNS